MAMETEKFEELKALTYNLIVSASKAKPIKGSRICFELGLSFRLVKQLISSLREEYPIVSKETDGGGYWLAEDTQDIVTFIKMIEARRSGYDETICKMRKYLTDDFEADSNHIPYID